MSETAIVAAGVSVISVILTVITMMRWYMPKSECALKHNSIVDSLAALERRMGERQGALEEEIRQTLSDIREELRRGNRIFASIITSLPIDQVKMAGLLQEVIGNDRPS